MASTALLTWGFGFFSGRSVERRTHDLRAATGLEFAIQGVLPRLRRDPLTGLTLRESFVQRVDDALKSGMPHAVIILDIDDFFELNAAIGYAAGDQVLAAVGERLAGLGLGASWARIGTDEFGLVLPHVSCRDDLESLSLRISRAFSTPLLTVERSVICKISLGAALMPTHATSLDGGVLSAQSALRRAKARGGGTWHVHDPKTEDTIRQKAALQLQLRLAIDSDQIFPFYQPVVDLRGGEIVGLEVLARWRHPEHGLVPPDVFIPLAEDMGITGQLTEKLMRQVIRDSRLWPSHLYLAFNISPGQLRDMIRLVQSPPAWPEGHLDPRRLAVEITESALIEDMDTARELIRLLQEWGAAVVLDDFGIGFSNFFHLRELPFDRIKIDKSFVLDCGYDPRAEACVRAMLVLAESLEIDMVAEGLERPEIAAYLGRLGCKFGQGYLFSRPVAAAEVLGLLRPKAAPVLRVVTA